MTKKEKNSEDWRALEGQANQLTRTILFIQKTIQPSVDILYNFNYYKLPRWRDLQNWLKLSILFRFILNSQEYVAFTLRFSKKKVTKALQGDIKKLPDYLRRRLSGNLHHSLGFIPPYLFGIHFDNNSSFHIHGVIKKCKNEKKLRKAIKTTAFGVGYSHLKINRAILCFGKLFLPEGWLKYIFKYKKYDDAIYVSRILMQQVKKLYENILMNYRNIKHLSPLQ